MQCFFADSTGIPPASASFPHAFQQSVENPCAEKVPAVSAAFNSYRSGLVESVVESCGMCFPQLVEAAFRVRQVFHDFSTNFCFPLHKLSTFPVWKKLSTFPETFHRRSVGKICPKFRGESAVSTFPEPLLLLLYILFFVFCLFAASLQKTADSMCCTLWTNSKKLFLLQLQKQEKRLNCVIFSVREVAAKDNRKDIGQHRYKTDTALSGTHVPNPIQN